MAGNKPSCTTYHTISKSKTLKRSEIVFMDDAQEFADYQSWAYNRYERLHGRHRYTYSWHVIQVHSPEEHERYQLTVRGGKTFAEAAKKWNDACEKDRRSRRSL